MFKIILIVMSASGNLLGKFDVYPHYFPTPEACQIVVKSAEFQRDIQEMSIRSAALVGSNRVTANCVSTGLVGPPLDANGEEVPRKPDIGLPLPEGEFRG